MKNNMKASSSTLILDGMFRSGTTFLSRIVDAFPRSYVLDDPVRVFHYYVTDKEGRGGYPRNMLRIEEVNLTSPPKSPDIFRSNFIMHIRQVKGLEIGLESELLKYIETISDKESFIEIFHNIIEVMRNYSGAELVGLKVTFHHRLREAIMDAMPHLKWITIIRDPRATYSSARISHSADIDFICKCWNDLIDSFNRVLPEHKNRFLCVRYEDLILEPSKTISHMARFLDIELDIDTFLKMLNLKDNFGKPWFSNSSYGNWENTNIKSPYFGRSSVQKWEETLNALEKRIIYRQCRENMDKMGYGKSKESKGFIKEIKDSFTWASKPLVVQSLMMSFVSMKTISTLKKHGLAIAIYRILIKAIYMPEKVKKGLVSLLKRRK